VTHREGQSESQRPADPLAAEAAHRVSDHELLHRIGSGTYGDVWLSRSALGTLRAVKFVYRSRFEDDRPFEREFRGIQKFEPVSRQHEGLVDVLHVGRDEGFFYYVMELADDAAENTGAQATASDLASYIPKTLAYELKRRGRLPVSECVSIGRRLAETLQHLHDHGLVHRDVKPSNVIIVQGVPKLADIGLVADVSEARSFVGTSGYIPPAGRFVQPGEDALRDVYGP